jgi:hypothetical protein
LILGLLVGVAEEWSEVSPWAQIQAGADNQQPIVYPSYDSLSAALSNAHLGNRNDQTIQFGSQIRHLTASGYHYYSLLEYEGSGSNSTFGRARLDVIIKG